jgi:hypothetical protein
MSVTDSRVVARRALLQLFEPLTGFVMDAGLSTKELHSILRHAAVRSVAARQREVSHRINISGIAATTGIPRSEISRILKLTEESEEQPTDRGQQSTNRILAAWHEEPRFTNANGQPAELKLYGRGTSFESLVKTHGGGIPTRAVLDELVRTRAVDVLPGQKVRARASSTVHRGISPRVIRDFGDRATELLSTMLSNMRASESPRFVASISGSTVGSNALPLLRKELSNKSTQFLAEVKECLMQEPIKKAGRDMSTMSVTVFYYESSRRHSYKRQSSSKRRNFRRKS